VTVGEAIDKLTEIRRLKGDQVRVCVVRCADEERDDEDDAESVIDIELDMERHPWGQVSIAAIREIR
jgi:hypothetical protein